VSQPSLLGLEISSDEDIRKLRGISSTYLLTDLLFQLSSSTLMTVGGKESRVLRAE
jgi:hypothetical protein